MRSRSAAALGLFLALAALSSAQPSGFSSRALPPDRAALERLNLRTEWTLHLPIEGTRDAIALVQTVDDQLFVQTKRGLLIAVDALTGRIQWSASLGNGGYVNVYPVAANSQFVFATNVTRLYAFYRYTGVTEFTTDLGTAPTTGLAADDSGVYAVLAIRPGAAGAHRVAAYDLPRPIAVVDPAARAGASTPGAGPRAVNPVDELTTRYPGEGAIRNTPASDSYGPSGASVRQAPTGGMTGSRTPSLAALPRVTPPYSLEGQPTSPSLAVVPSLRQPYRMRDDSQRDIQKTPSIGTIPPSVAAALALTDLRPKGVEPRLRWEYGLTSRVVWTPSQSPLRVWVATDGRALLALSKVDKTTEVVGSVSEQVSAAPVQAGTVGYVPLADGTLLAVDLTGGNVTGGLNLVWRTNVGGIMSRTPVVTEDAVFAAGDNSGVARVDRATGDVIWHTSDRAADRVVAVNQEFVYIRDRQGRLLVFDARRATDPATRLAAPLTGIDLPAFNVPVVNTVSDRVYLAADNGLLVCLRDASAKYAAPVRMVPPPTVDPAPRAGVNPPKDPGMPMDAMPMAAMPMDAVPPKGADPKLPDPKLPDPKGPAPKGADPKAPPPKKMD